MNAPPPGALAALLGEILRLHRAGAAAGGPEAATLAEVAAALAALDPGAARFPPPAAVPARAHLPAALADAARGPLAALAAAFAGVEPGCAWRRNPNYADGSAGPGFLEGYGYVELAGPKGPLVSTAVRAGFLLLAPGLLYPDHAHPAVECYHVVAGADGGWWDEATGWRRVAPGGAAFHPSGRRHAMRAGATPLLALYAWTGAVGIEARIHAEEARA